LKIREYNITSFFLQQYLGTIPCLLGEKALRFLGDMVKNQPIKEVFMSMADSGILTIGDTCYPDMPCQHCVTGGDGSIDGDSHSLVQEIQKRTFDAVSSEYCAGHFISGSWFETDDSMETLCRYRDIAFDLASKLHSDRKIVGCSLRDEDLLEWKLVRGRLVPSVEVIEGGNLVPPTSEKNPKMMGALREKKIEKYIQVLLGGITVRVYPAKKVWGNSFRSLHFSCGDKRLTLREGVEVIAEKTDATLRYIPLKNIYGNVSLAEVITFPTKDFRDDDVVNSDAMKISEALIGKIISE
jgi:hypothetical protein